MTSQYILLFDLVGVLVEGAKVRQCYRQEMARVMTQRYGKSPDFWQAIDEQIVADWDYYHADLNFGGEDGIADMHEALFRVTRALFRIADIAEPPKPDITALSRELIGLPYCNTLRPDAEAIVKHYHAKGYQIGVLSYFLQMQTQAIMQGTPIVNHINHVISPDTLNHYNHDRQFFSKLAQFLGVSSSQVILITSSSQTHTTATEAGIHTILVRQSSASFEAILKTKLTEIRKT